MNSVKSPSLLVVRKQVRKIQTTDDPSDKLLKILANPVNKCLNCNEVLEDWNWDNIFIKIMPKR